MFHAFLDMVIGRMCAKSGASMLPCKGSLSAGISHDVVKIASSRCVVRPLSPHCIFIFICHLETQFKNLKRLLRHLDASGGLSRSKRNITRQDAARCFNATCVDPELGE